MTELPIFASDNDALQWWAQTLRAEGFFVTIDGLTTEAGAAFLLGRAPRTLANWRSAGTGPSWRRRRQVVYALRDLIAWDTEQATVHDTSRGFLSRA